VAPDVLVLIFVGSYVYPYAKQLLMVLAFLRTQEDHDVDMRCCFDRGAEESLGKQGVTLTSTGTK